MDIQLRDSEVSRRHAAIEIRELDVELIDLNATNGTWFNGNRIHREKLGHQDEVTLGVGVNTQSGMVVLRMNVAPAGREAFVCNLSYSPEEATKIAMILAKAAHDVNELARASQSNLVLPPALKLVKGGQPEPGSVMAKRAQSKR